jgi:hypothetical protein
VGAWRRTRRPRKLSDLLFGDLRGVGDADLVAAALLALAACLVALAAAVLRPPRAAAGRAVRRSPIEALGGAPR